MRINELPEDESARVLDYLFRFQLEPRFRYVHHWNENDLLIWGHLGTIHRAIAGCDPDEIQLMRRSQVMVNGVFDAEFLHPAREAALQEASGHVWGHFTKAAIPPMAGRPTVRSAKRHDNDKVPDPVSRQSSGWTRATRRRTS